MEGRDDGSDDERNPDEGSEDDSRNARAIDGSAAGGGPPVAVAPKHSHSDPCRKPENHCEEFNTSNGELVRGAGESCRRQDEICYSEQCPNRCKDHKVNAVRRPAPPWVGECIGNICRQAEYNDRKEDLDAAEAEDDGRWEGHLSCCRWR